LSNQQKRKQLQKIEGIKEGSDKIVH